MNESPNLLERLANALFVESSPDVTPVYEHSWPLTTSAAVLIVMAFAAFTFFVYAREKTSASRFLRWSMAVMRVAAFALIVFMMFGWMLRQHRVDLPDLAVAVDVSGSMDAKDAYQTETRRRDLDRLTEASVDETARIELVKQAFAAANASLLDKLAQRFNVKLYFVSSGAAAQSGASPSSLLVDAVADGEHSRLGDGVRSVLELQRGRPTSSLILVTDGVTTAGQSLASAAQYARRTSMPVFTVGVGDDQTPKDARVGDLLVEEVAFAGDLIHFDFKVSASGYEGRKLRVKLHKKGQESTLDETTITLGPDDESQAARLSHREEQKGKYTFVIQADVLDKETDKDNNRIEREIQVREETIRVLLVQEYPSFEFRFLKTLLDRGLKRESTSDEKLFELTTILQEADLDYAELDNTARRVFPVSQDELFAYDVLIFGDVNRSLFSNSTLQLVADFVRERGGGVVFLAGPRHTPLDYRDTPIADLFPFDATTAVAPPPDAVLDESYQFGVRPSRLGMASPQLQVADSVPASLRAWTKVPKMQFLVETPDMRPAARVLLEHPTKQSPDGAPLPIVSMQFVGAGKVVFHNTDESYRWLRHGDGEDLYDRYWLQTMRFLARSRLLGADRGAEVSSDRREYRRGEAVTLRVRFLDERKAPPQDDGVVLVLEQSGGKRRQLRLTRGSVDRESFEAQISGLVDGRYRAWLATPTLDGQPPSHEFTITPPLGERSRIQMDRAELTRAAKITGGRFLLLEDAADLLKFLPEGRKVRIESMPPEPVWNSNYLACLIVVLLVGEWLLRKRVGML